MRLESRKFWGLRFATTPATRLCLQGKLEHYRHPTYELAKM